MSLFDLLARFLEYLFVWFPRPVYVPKSQAIVRWTWGRDPVVISGAIPWVVPLFQDYERVDLRAHSDEFEPKVLWTKDGHEAAVGMAVVWRVNDALVHCTLVDDTADLVARVGETVLPELVGRFELAALKRKASGGEGREWGFDTHLRNALNAVLGEYGIAVDLARLNFTSDRVRTFKLVTGGAL